MAHGDVKIPGNQNQCMESFHVSHQQALCKIFPLELLQAHYNMKIPPHQHHTTHPQVPVQPIRLVYNKIPYSIFSYHKIPIPFDLNKIWTRKKLIK